MCRYEALEKQIEEQSEQSAKLSKSLNEMEAAYEGALKELSDVKQRARALLEEKDLQLQAARVSSQSQNLKTWHLISL